MHTVEENKRGITNLEIRDAEKARSAYNLVGHPSAADFEHVVRGNMLKNFSIIVTDIKNSDTIYGPDIGYLRGKSIRKNRNINAGLCENPRADKIKNKTIELSVDVIFFNKIPFMISLGNNMKFATI